MQQKRDAFASGSWNIREEIRRVRAKATEDMLGSSPTMKTNLSEFEHRTNQTSLVFDRTGVGLGDKMDYSNSLAAFKSIDASSNLASEPATGLVLAGAVFASLMRIVWFVDFFINGGVGSPFLKIISIFGI